MEPSITQVTVGKTINIGNFETIRVDLTARVNEGENWREILKALKLLVREQELAIQARRKLVQEG